MIWWILLNFPIFFPHRQITFLFSTVTVTSQSKPATFIFHNLFKLSNSRRSPSVCLHFLHCRYASHFSLISWTVYSFNWTFFFIFKIISKKIQLCNWQNRTLMIIVNDLFLNVDLIFKYHTYLLAKFFCNLFQCNQIALGKYILNLSLFLPVFKYYLWIWDLKFCEKLE